MKSKIPTYFATKEMETSRLPRPPVGIADVGAGIEAEAMGQFGKVMFDVSGDLLAKLEEQRTVSQFTEGKAMWARSHTEFFTKLVKDPDFENYEKKYTAFTKSLRRQILKKGLTRRAKQGLTNYITQEQPGMEKETAIAVMEKQRYHGRATMLRSINDFERSGNAPAAHAAIQEAHESGFITAEAAERQRQAVSANIDWYKGLMLIDSDPESFLKKLEAEPVPIGEAEEGIAVGAIPEPTEKRVSEFLPSLNPEQKLALKARAIRQYGAGLAQGRAIREQQINAEQGRLMRLARSGELTDDIIRESALDEFGTGSKNTFYSILDARAEAAIAEKDEPFLRSDPQVLARTLDEIRDPESKITEKDISGLVSKGLSVVDGDRLIGRLDVFKSFWFREADKHLKNNLGWSDTFTKFMHPEGALAYSLALNELFDAVETENLKGRELLERAIGIASPYMQDYWRQSNFLTPERIEQLAGMLEPPIAEPPPTKVKPTKVLTPKEKAARSARIRSWVVPFNQKYKTKLQPSVLDAMSDEYINWLDSLSSVRRDVELKKLLGRPAEVKAKTKKETGSKLDPLGAFEGIIE